jgi:hypothetical protein
MVIQWMVDSQLLDHISRTSRRHTANAMRLNIGTFVFNTAGKESDQLRVNSIKYTKLHWLIDHSFLKNGHTVIYSIKSPTIAVKLFKFQCSVQTKNIWLNCSICYHQNCIVASAGYYFDIRLCDSLLSKLPKMIARTPSKRDHQLNINRRHLITAMKKDAD